MYKRFFEQRITHYNGRWYCYLCKTALQNLIEAQGHSQKAHPDISMQMSNFLNKSVKMSNKRHSKLLKHGIVIRDVQQDYFCLPCQCPISSLQSTLINQHLQGKNHKKCILKCPINKQQNLNDNINDKQSNVPVNIKSPTEDSTNEQQNINDDINNKQSNVPVNIESPNKSNSSAKIQPICEDKLVKDLSNDSTEMVNGTITNIVPYALMQEAKTYKSFLMQHTIHYGRWYCHLCKSMLRSLAEAECHLQEVHSDIRIQLSDSLDKSVELSDANCRELNHETVMQGIPQDYFCVPCQSSIPSLHHFYEHSIGRKHERMNKCNKEYIIASIILEDPASKQQNLNNDIIDSLNAPVNVSDGNDLIKDLPNNFRAEKENMVSSETCSKYNISDVLQIERGSNMAFCCLCDVFFNVIMIDDHMLSKRHMSVIRSLRIFEQQEACIIKFERNRKIIKPLQLNSKRLDGTVWPEYIDTAAKYTCDQCNKVVEENGIINHEMKVHESSVMSFMKYICDWMPMSRDFNIAMCYPLFRCSFCNEIIHGLLSLQTHFSKREHEENIKLLTYIKRLEYDNCKNVQIYFEPLEFLSLISFENNGGTVEIREQPIIYVKNHHTTFKNSIWKKSTYICLACYCTVNDTQDIIKHLSEKLKHLKHFRNIFLTYDYIYNVSTSKEISLNETHEANSLVYGEEQISMNDGSLKKCSINETQVNTGQFTHNHSLIAASNLIAYSISKRNDTLRQNEESDSGFFISPNISRDINMLIKNVNFGPNPLLSCTKFNKKSALARYNRKYRKEFLDFEEIMFACNKKKLKEIKLHLQFFLPYCNKMLCLVCNDLQLYSAQTIYEHINCGKHVTNFMKLHENSEHLELLTELIKVESNAYFQYATCYVCNEHIDRTFQNTSENNDYKNHTHFPSHRNNRKRLLSQAEQILEEFQTLWYNIQYFACVECNKRFKRKIEFMEHLDVAHRAVLSGKDNSKFDFCLTCATLWYKNESFNEEICNTYQRHCLQRTHQYLEKSNDFAVTLLPQSLRKLLSNVDKTIADMFKLSNDILNDPKVIQLRDALKHTFEARQLPVEVCMFGSRVTGLALRNSDIDIYLNFGDECIEPKLIKSRSKQIQDCLRTDRENWDIELALDRSRTPLIKVKHRSTGLQCDISFTNGLSVENSKLIRSFNAAYPACQKLALFLKKWISLGGLTGSDGITNYALVWLVIFYLQDRFNIPSVAALIKSHNQSKIISGWETGVSDTIPINVPEVPIHELLLGFFEYYGSFDYMYLVICPLLGKTCYKKAFMDTSTLPDAMALYIAQLGNEKSEYFRVDSPMCVQDPFDLSHNLTKAVPILTLKRFKCYCDKSLSVLHNVIATSSKIKKYI